MKKETYLYISILNVLSAIAVIILHANGAFWGYRSDSSWAINNIIECIFYFAVPIFFMLTGATLLDYQERYSTKEFLKKRFLKTFIPFVFWSLFTLFFYNVIRGKSLSVSPSGIFNGFFNYEYVDVFWFFGPLFCAYLSIPLFASIAKNKKLKTLTYISTVGILLNVAIPFVISLLNYFLKTNFKWSNTLTVIGNYLIFVILGYLLHKITLKKKYRIAIYILAIFGLLAHILGTYFLSRENGQIIRLFKGYANLPSVLYSVGFFVFIKQISSKHFIQKFSKPFIFLQKYTFAFYLIHRFVITYTSAIILKIGIANGSILYVFLTALLTIPACIIITFVIRKLLGGKYILP